MAPLDSTPMIAAHEDGNYAISVTAAAAASAGPSGRSNRAHAHNHKASRVNSMAQDAGLLNAIDASSTMELHRSNLMRMQTHELLEECQLRDLKSRKWATKAHEYLQRLTNLIKSIEIASGHHSSHDHTKSGKANSKKNKKGSSSSSSSSTPSLVIQGTYKDRADKVVHIEMPSLTPSSSSSSQDAGRLSVEPIGCTRSNLGWMKKSGNAQVPPTFTLMVMLPEGLLASKDYLHYRYFDKRNFVMHKVAVYLAKHADELGTVEYKWANGTHRPPMVQLVPPTSKGSPKFQVHVHFGMKSVDWIPPLRLVPNRSNIRNDNDGDDETDLDVQSDDDNLKRAKSQSYNQSLLFDARHQFEDQQLSALVHHQNTEATLALIQVWALQRGLWRNHDGWTQENVAIFLLYLLRTNRMNARMTPIQQLTVVMQFWATTDWLGDGASKTTSSAVGSKKETMRASQSEASQFTDTSTQKKHRTVLVLPSEDVSEKDTIRESELARLYEAQTNESPLTDSDPPTLVKAYASTRDYCLGPVMLDPTMKYNYLADVSPNYMALLQSHARKGLEALKAPRSAFTYMFMENERFWSCWDMYVKIPVKKTTEDIWESSVRDLVRKLELALGNRIHGLRLLSTGNGNVQREKELADEIPTVAIGKSATYIRPTFLSPTGSTEIILGISVNPETSRRIVDRGPPSDQTKAVKEFLQLWGKKKAQLRRFKDGAIVQAVVWNEEGAYGYYHNSEKVQGGYIEKIVRHIVELHYTNEPLEVPLPNLLSIVDGIGAKDESSPTPFVDPLLGHQEAMKAFESLAQYLRQHSQTPVSTHRSIASLGLPLPIDAVEPLSPCLRYSKLFPPVSHPSLGGASFSKKRVSGALVSDPILIQIRFGASSKWPTDLKAIGAAKTAMLIQLANGIESMNDRSFDGPTLVTPSYLDQGYRGYCFRILVRADPEIKMLEGLVKPSPEASTLLKDLTRVHVIAAKHHSMIHAVHTLHPSAPFVVRMAERWCASHLLSGLMPTTIVELLVARVYSEGNTTMGPPATLMAGFLRFLHLLARHDWAGEPFIVNPRGHISDDDMDLINHQFEKARGETRESGPPMYIVAPYDKVDAEEESEEQSTSFHNAVNTRKDVSWRPNTISPERVILNRAVALARRSHDYMMDHLSSFVENSPSDWSAIFQECPQSFQSFDVLLRVNPDLVVDPEASSTKKDLGPTSVETADKTAKLFQSSYTRSMTARHEGPKALRKKIYRNLAVGAGDATETVLPAWNPARSMVETLRSKFGRHALFFYNDLAPEVIGIVWRPQTFATMPFSAMTAEYARPVQAQQDWTNDTLVSRSATDLLRDMSVYFQDIVTTVKVLNESGLSPAPFSKKQKLSA